MGSNPSMRNMISQSHNVKHFYSHMNAAISNPHERRLSKRSLTNLIFLNKHLVLGCAAGTVDLSNKFCSTHVTSEDSMGELNIPL